MKCYVPHNTINPLYYELVDAEIQLISCKHGGSRAALQARVDGLKKEYERQELEIPEGCHF